MTPPVTRVTTHAVTADTLTGADYRDIYTELRARMSLRAFVDQVDSQYSIAWWSKYERSELELTRPARQELRRAVGLAPLPPTVAEATAGVDPDAAVYQVGDLPADRLILIGAAVSAADGAPLTLRINGDVHALDAEPGARTEPSPTVPVTPVTRPPRPAPRGTIHLPLSAWQRLSAARQAAGVTWEQFLAPLTEVQP